MIAPDTEEIAVGLDIGAIHTAEALLLARFFMYSQVYLHDVRRVYDLHLKEFLQAWLKEGKFSCDWKELLKMTDHEVLVAMRGDASDPASERHELAARVLNREHYRTAYELMAPHKKKRPAIFQELLQYAKDGFGTENVRSDSYGPKSETNDFPVLMDDGTVESSLQVSSVISNVPPIDIGLIFVARQFKDDAKSKLAAKTRSLLFDDKKAPRQPGGKNGV